MFKSTFLSFIIKSPEYYDVPDEKAGDEVGSLGFYSEIVVILFDLVLGFIMDNFGRKLPTVIGFGMAGVSIIMIPFGKNIYPTLLILM